MRNRIRPSLLMIILCVTTLTQAIPLVQQQTNSPDKSDRANILAEDTPVKLRLSQNLSSGTAKVNDKVDFEVIEDVKVGNRVVIAQGATAIATVTKATPKKSFGRAGKLDVNIDYVRLTNGDKVGLRAVKGGSGGSHTGAMTGAVVASAIVFFPAAPLFFFIKGKNIEIPKGTEITAYVAADTSLDPSTFGAKSVTAETPPVQSLSQPTSAGSSSFATLLVKSTPDGGEIVLDGKFVGSTSSTLQVAPGEHTIIIQKPGFKPWQRTINLTANGNITIDATLEKLE